MQVLLSDDVTCNSGNGEGMRFGENGHKKKYGAVRLGFAKSEARNINIYDSAFGYGGF